MRLRPLFWPTLWTIPALLVLVGLGIWQLQRHEWKSALIADISAKLTTTPAQMDAIEDARSRGERIDYRPVIVAGQFDHAHEVYYYVPAPVDPEEGPPGYHVITPLVRMSGPTVLVDRGYVPDNYKDPATRPDGQVEGFVTVRGVVRESVRGGWLTPRPDPKTRVFYARDLDAMAKSLGLLGTVPFFIEADSSRNPGGWPRGGQTRADLPNNHLSYALTWFGLAVALAGVYLVYHRHRGRLG